MFSFVFVYRGHGDHKFLTRPAHPEDEQPSGMGMPGEVPDIFKMSCVVHLMISFEIES